MNTALWIITTVLALGFTAGGLALLTLPRDRYRALGANQHWVDDFGDGQLKAIGAIKLTGALGLILPAVTGIATVLSPPGRVRARAVHVGRRHHAVASQRVGVPGRRRGVHRRVRVPLVGPVRAVSPLTR